MDSSTMTWKDLEMAHLRLTCELQIGSVIETLGLTKLQATELQGYIKRLIDEGDNSGRACSTCPLSLMLMKKFRYHWPDLDFWTTQGKLWTEAAFQKCIEAVGQHKDLGSFVSAEDSPTRDDASTGNSTSSSSWSGDNKFSHTSSPGRSPPPEYRDVLIDLLTDDKAKADASKGKSPDPSSQVASKFGPKTGSIETPGGLMPKSNYTPVTIDKGSSASALVAPVILPGGGTNKHLERSDQVHGDQGRFFASPRDGQHRNQADIRSSAPRVQIMTDSDTDSDDDSHPHPVSPPRAPTGPGGDGHAQPRLRRHSISETASGEPSRRNNRDSKRSETAPLLLENTPSAVTLPWMRDPDDNSKLIYSSAPDRHTTTDEPKFSLRGGMAPKDRYYYRELRPRGRDTRPQSLVCSSTSSSSSSYSSTPPDSPAIESRDLDSDDNLYDRTSRYDGRGREPSDRPPKPMRPLSPKKPAPLYPYIGREQGYDDRSREPSDRRPKLIRSPSPKPHPQLYPYLRLQYGDDYRDGEPSDRPPKPMRPLSPKPPPQLYPYISRPGGYFDNIESSDRHKGTASDRRRSHQPFPETRDHESRELVLARKHRDRDGDRRRDFDRDFDRDRNPSPNIITVTKPDLGRSRDNNPYHSHSHSRPYGRDHDHDHDHDHDRNHNRNRDHDHDRNNTTRRTHPAGQTYQDLIAPPSLLAETHHSSLTRPRTDRRRARDDGVEIIRHRRVRRETYRRRHQVQEHDDDNDERLEIVPRESFLGAGAAVWVEMMYRGR